MTDKSKKLRNPFHNHPLMRKGGIHQKSDKAKRQHEKQKIRNEWGCLMALLSLLLNNSVQRESLA